MNKAVVCFNQASDNKCADTGWRIQSAILLLLYLLLSAGCDQSEPPPAELLPSVVVSWAKSAAIQEPASALQYPVPDRAPIEVISLPNSIYGTICILGNPFMVKGWSLDPDTRFIYFTGPFIMSGSEPFPYLYKSIGSLSRQRVSTTMRLRTIEEEPERTKPDELQQFLLPHLTGVDANPREVKRVLGEPDFTRKLKKSGRTRIIYDKRICFGKKLLVGMYLDIANGSVVKAKGIAHPERLKWVISGNRPPAPDTEPTYYLDQKPLNDSPQDILIWFIMSRERGDQASARKLISESQFMGQAEEITKASDPGVDIEFSTLTYQTTHYELDVVEVTVTYQLNSGRRIEASHRLRKLPDGWRIIR